MSRPIGILDHELGASAPVRPPDDCRVVRCLLRAGGVPLGEVTVPVIEDDAGRRLDALRLSPNAVAGALSRRLARRVLERGLPAGLDELDVAALLYEDRPAWTTDWPAITVAVCSRDRPEDAAHCLAALARLDYPVVEVLLVDNAPLDDATRDVAARFPRVRYLREPRPGLNWARNRALAEARGEIIAFTDDDAVVDTRWLRALARPFLDSPAVAAVTGLVLPLELATDAQQLFERYGGFGRGFVRRWARFDPADPARWRLLGTGQFGTGANMAFRTRVLRELGGFDPALDVGTITHGGGDLEMLFRVLREGGVLCYEPAAVVRHRHRRELAELARQVEHNGTGFRAYLERTRAAYPEERRAVARLARWWLWRWQLPRLGRAFVNPGRFPPRMLWAELTAFLGRGGRWRTASQTAARLADGAPLTPLRPASSAPDSVRHAPPARAVLDVDLAAGLDALSGVEAYAEAEVWIRHRRRLLGRIRFRSGFGPVGPLELGDRIAARLGLRLLDPDRCLNDRDLRQAVAAMIMQGAESLAAPPRGLSPTVAVSLVIATRDRPESLARCLASIEAQATPRPVEVIVVDNHPASGLTRPVVQSFAVARYVEEPRRGLSWARNAGIRVASGEIVVTTDDDVTMPPEWLETLLEPFTAGNVTAVTGNALPRHLDSEAEVLFERYGGLGRGVAPLLADRAWMDRFRWRAVPTWRLGATANAAFRAEVFGDPEVGLFDEALGAGTATGCSEDTDLFYRILRAGGAIRYHPDAWVRHEHRNSHAALRHQIYAYSKGHVAYHLVIAGRYGDLRSIWRLAAELPAWRARQIWRWCRARMKGSDPAWPLSLVLVEIAGNLAGPAALLRSRYTARRLRRRAPPSKGS